MALKSVSIALVALVVAQIVVAVYPHPRPFMINMGMGRTLIEHAPDPSFPSDHLTLFSSIAIAYFIGRYYIISIIFSIIGLCVAWSRIYLGVHFPFDMIGSILISLLVAIGIQPIWKLSFTNIVIEIYEKLLKLPIKRVLFK